MKDIKRFWRVWTTKFQSFWPLPVVVVDGFGARMVDNRHLCCMGMPLWGA